MTRNRSAKSLTNVQFLPLEFLQEALDYNPETGTLIWKARPRHHFESDWRMNNVNSRWTGKKAGQLAQGYVRIEITYNGAKYICLGHHLAWKMSGMVFPPEHDIDHRNHIRNDNRITNLRPAKRRQNTKNRKMDPRNTVGVRGVTRHSGGYIAQITVDYEHHYLGWFKELDDAAVARREAELKFYGEFAPNSSVYGDQPFTDDSVIYYPLSDPFIATL